MINRTVFLSSLLLLFLEFFSSVRLSFVVTPAFSIPSIGLAVFGLSLAPALLIFKTKWLKWDSERLISFAVMALPYSLLINYFVEFLVKEETNKAFQLGSKSDLISRATAHQETLFMLAPVVGLSLLLPYFLIGVIIILLFERIGQKRISKAYFFDLLGGAVGCFLCYLLLEHSSFYLCTLIPYLIVLAISVTFYRAAGLKISMGKTLFGTAPLLFILIWGRQFEPRANMDLLAHKSGTSATFK
jgi:hypothetical protein